MVTLTKERGTIFNGEMVRAILDGRKTQTRRVMKVQPCNEEQELFILKNSDDGKNLGKFSWVDVTDSGYEFNSDLFPCPFGKVGDRLYVRETWGAVSHSFDDDGLMTDWIPDRPAKAIHELPYGRGYYNGHAIYAADGDFTWGDDDGGDERSCWKPSIHMPKAASRITLEITDIRVERLNDISEQDARSEGITDGGCLNCGEPEPCCCESPKPDAVDSFAYFWESIYGQDSWQSNPFVWVVEFKCVEAA